MQKEMLFSEMQKICLKHCVHDILQPEFSVPQVTCLQRCSFKYHEAIDFGFEVFKFHESFIAKQKQDQEENRKAQQVVYEKQEDYKKQFWSILKKTK